MDLERRFPLAVFALCVVLSLALAPWPDILFSVVASETGLIELGTVAVALWCVALAIRIVMERRLLPHPAMAIWFGLFAVGLFFLAGEEISWGQSWLHWRTPDAYAALNRQGETNLHNLASFNFVEALPKGLIILAALVTLVWAARARRRSPTLGGWFGWLWPSATLWPVAALVWVVRIGERVMVWTGLGKETLRAHHYVLRESVELFCVLFILAYLHNVRGRMLSQGGAET